MTRILLIRHGETELTGRVLYGRMPGVHISAEGCRQAQALSQALKERYQVDEIISSPLERALETAQYLADTLNLPISTDDGIVGPRGGRSSELGHDLRSGECRESRNQQRHDPSLRRTIAL